MSTWHGAVAFSILMALFGGCVEPSNAPQDSENPTNGATADQLVAGMGEPVWLIQLPCRDPSTPVVSGSTAVVSCFVNGIHQGDYRSILAAIDVPSGEILWIHEESAAAFGAPAILDDRVLVPGSTEPADGAHCSNNPGVVRVFSVVDGTAGGTYPSDPDSISCEDEGLHQIVATWEDLALILTSSGVLAVDTLDLQPVWRFNAPNNVTGTPVSNVVVDKGKFLVGSLSGIDTVVRALDSRTGAVSWTHTVPGETVHSVALHKEQVLAATESGSVDVLNVSTGALVTSHRTGVLHSIAVDGATLWTSHSGGTQARALADFTPQFSIPCKPPLVFRDGFVLARCSATGAGPAIWAVHETSGKALWAYEPPIHRGFNGVAATEGLVIVTNTAGAMIGIDASGSHAKRSSFEVVEGSLGGSVLEVKGLACLRIELENNGERRVSAGFSGFAVIDAEGEASEPSAPPFLSGGEYCSPSFPQDVILYPGESIQGHVAFCNLTTNHQYTLTYRQDDQYLQTPLTLRSPSGFGCE